MTGFLSELVPQVGARWLFGNGLDALGSKIKPFCVLGRPLGPKEAQIAIQEARRGTEDAKKEGPRRPDID